MPPNSALHVQPAIPQPEQVSPYLQFKRKKRLTIDAYIDGILAGNRVVLSQAITLVESMASQDIEIANQIIEQCLPYSGNSIRIGITGVPGVGKSTFIEAFGKYLTSIGKKLAVLAVDPSSELSKGSILGDKTRMEELAIDPNAFIRPSPSGSTLGGVARKTRETIILCEAAGFDAIIIETVGVGQSETMVKSMVDFFLLLMLSGAGDELQGIKRGIMEMADALIITKADGDNVGKATAAKALYQSALQLFPKNENGWEPPVDTCSVYHKESIEKIWQLISGFEKATKENGFFFKHRTEQSVKTFFDWMNHLLKERFYADATIENDVNKLIPEIRAGKVSPYRAGGRLVQGYEKTMKKLILFITIFLSVLMVKADEGMWLLSLLNKNYEKMQEMGLTLSTEDIYSINNASMKDAVVQFGRGCTGEIISNQGLLLTNHHCGYGNIQALSTPENNILANGFWAKTLADELPCEGLTATFFVRMEDVTDFMLNNLNDEMSEQQRKDTISKRTRELEKEYGENNKYRVRIANMFNGNAYYLFIYQVYNDVRLVGVPPASMGKFGGDTDNWMWPRHTADFSLFRVYSDVNGNPAEYSEENIPLVPKWFFPISTSGIKEGGFAMILGFPGSTDRFLPSYGVKMAIEEKNPTIVNARDVKLTSWKAFRESDPVIDLQYASKYARISNYWKYYIGETKQLINNDVVAKKEQIETDFQNWVKQNNKTAYKNVLSDMADAYKEISKFEKFTNLYNQAIFQGPEIFSLARQANLIHGLLKKQEKQIITNAEKKQLETHLTSLKSEIESFFKNYNLLVDKATTAKLLELFYNETTPDQRPQAFSDAVKKSKNDFNKLTENLFKKTMLGDRNLIEKFLKNPNTTTLDKDLALSWYVMFSYFYHQTILPLVLHKENLDRANRLFIRGLMEMNSDKLYAPNANSQIRLTYGKVGGYPIKDGLTANYYTTLDGVMAKEDPNSREFQIPLKLKTLYETKDYGAYSEDGQIRVNFLTDNDITGGNSGSPVINAKGELIGCAFDGNWEAMSGDIFFEPNLQRCINVDIRYILFIIDKFGDAKHLIDEMQIISN